MKVSMTALGGKLQVARTTRHTAALDQMESGNLGQAVTCHAVTRVEPGLPNWETMKALTATRLWRHRNANRYEHNEVSDPQRSCIWSSWIAGYCACCGCAAGHMPGHMRQEVLHSMTCDLHFAKAAR